MGVIIDSGLPAFNYLVENNLSVREKGNRPSDATIALINLMPIKQDTECDFLRIMAPSVRWIDIELIRMASHRNGKNTPQEHLDRFYTTFDAAAPRLDGVIITGAPLENVAFEDVDYWREITAIFEQLRRNNIPTLYICWAAFAALWHWWKIPMQLTDRKISGLYPSRLLIPKSPLMQGISDGFYIPVSRYATWNSDEINTAEGLLTIADGDSQGKFLLCSERHPEWFMTGHGEYGLRTLHNEYIRDLGRGLNPHIPDHYYPDDNPDATPLDRWSHTAERMMSNWIEIVVENKLKNND